MLSPKELAQIVRDEIKDKIRNHEIFELYNYILLNGEIYPRYKYEEEVANGIRSANDIYAYVNVWPPSGFDAFLLYANYLSTTSVKDVVNAYLRKAGFTIEYRVVQPPTPNLKYFIYAVVEYTREHYLVIDIYDVDTLAKIFHIPQIVEQELGSQPRKIKEYDVDDIKSIVTEKQPLLAGHTYEEAWDILADYYVYHKKDYKNEAYKIAFAYMNFFPEPYKVCYEWKAGIFIETNCLKLELHSSSS